MVSFSEAGVLRVGFPVTPVITIVSIIIQLLSFCHE